MATTQIVGCAFCRSRNLPWAKHSIEECSALHNHQCTYCKGFGHTNSRCPKSILAKHRKEEYATREQFKANCWAAHVAKNIPLDVVDKISESDRIVKENRDALRKMQKEKERLRQSEATERWKERYVRRMQHTYGLKQSRTLPAIAKYLSHSSLPDDGVYLPYGEFWYFYVEGGKDEDTHGIAKTLRDDETNRMHFHLYLKEQLSVNWLEDSANTDFDCQYLADMRYQQHMADEIAYYNQLERDRQFELHLEEEYRLKEQDENTMRDMLANGEVTQEVFDRWEMAKMEDEMDDYESYHVEGIRLYEKDYRDVIISKRAMNKWMKRR